MSNIAAATAAIAALKDLGLGDLLAKLAERSEQQANQQLTVIKTLVSVADENGKCDLMTAIKQVLDPGNRGKSEYWDNEEGDA